MAEEEGDEFLEPSAEVDEGQGERSIYSPDGSVRITFYPEERRNNEWCEMAFVRDVASGETLLTAPYFYETTAAFTGPRNFALWTGEGFGRGAIRVDVDVDSRTGCIAATGATFPLAAAEAPIRRAYEDYVASLPPLPSPPVMAQPPRPDRARPIEVARIGVFAVFVLAAALIAGYMILG